MSFFENLTAHTNYNFRVKAVNDGGDSEFSDIFNAVTLVNIPSKPATPTATTV